MCQIERACLAPGSECSFKEGKGEKDRAGGGGSEEEQEGTEKRGGKGGGQKSETQP